MVLSLNPMLLVKPHSELYFRLDVDEQTEKGRLNRLILLDWWGRQDKEVMMEALGDENRN